MDSQEVVDHRRDKEPGRNIRFYGKIVGFDRLIEVSLGLKTSYRFKSHLFISEASTSAMVLSIVLNLPFLFIGE